MKIRKSKSAFSLIELMISLVVAALILTAVAMALDACIVNYQANRDISGAVIKANQALARIVSDLRDANAIDIAEPNNQCSMFKVAGDWITYRYEQSSGKIYLIDNHTATSHVLCDGISAAVFDRTTGINELGQLCVKSVQIILTVGTGNSAHNACAAVVIRRNL